MPPGARSVPSEATIVEASNRFARKGDVEPFDLNRELAAALERLMLPKSEPASSSLGANDSTPVDDAATDKTLPSYLEALEMISSAAEVMASMESHSQRVEAKAYEIAERARYDVRVAQEEVAALRAQFNESLAKIEDLNRRAAEAEGRAQTAQQWLIRFQQATTRAFSTRRLSGLRCPTA